MQLFSSHLDAPPPDRRAELPLRVQLFRAQRGNRHPPRDAPPPSQAELAINAQWLSVPPNAPPPWPPAFPYNVQPFRVEQYAPPPRPEAELPVSAQWFSVP